METWPARIQCTRTGVNVECTIIFLMGNVPKSIVFLFFLQGEENVTQWRFRSARLAIELNVQVEKQNKKNVFMEGKKWSATVTHGIQPATVPTVHYEGEEVSCWQREKTCNQWVVATHFGQTQFPFNYFISHVLSSSQGRKEETPKYLNNYIPEASKMSISPTVALVGCEIFRWRLFVIDDYVLMMIQHMRVNDFLSLVN